MKYLKKFNNHAEYEAYLTEGMILPNVSHCIEENEVHYNPYVHDYADDYLTFVALESGTFTFAPRLTINIISYSTDNGKIWTEGNSINVNEGDKVLWKGTMTPYAASKVGLNGIGKFSSTGRFNVQGNVMSLLYDDNYKGQIDLTGKNYAFYELFNGNTKMINAKNLSLPATILAQSCYEYMFSGCTNLITAPELPATTLANYCYEYMFSNCTSLTTPPSKLPATRLAELCYQSMFNKCTSLTTAPQLPATSLAKHCYNGMFKYCTSLVNAPELPAMKLVNYCYIDMFNGCTKLNYIKAMFTTTPSATYTGNWVKGVASTGTFVKNSAATWNVTGVDGIPTGWTVQTAIE